MINIPPPAIVWEKTISKSCTLYDNEVATTFDGTIEALHKNSDGSMNKLYGCFTWNQMEHLPSSEVVKVFFVDPKYPNVIRSKP